MMKEEGGNKGRENSGLPGPNRHVRQRVIISSYVLASSQMLVQLIQLALDFHADAVDRVFILLLCVVKEVTKTSS